MTTTQWTKTVHPLNSITHTSTAYNHYWVQYTPAANTKVWQNISLCEEIMKLGAF